MKHKVIGLMLSIVMFAGGITTDVYAANLEVGVVGSVAETPITDFEYRITDEDEIEITKYNGTAAEVVIPGIIEGSKVTSIGDSAFWWNDTISSVVLPEELEKIQDYAFWGCNSLQGIEIPDTVTYIGERAFSGSSFVELNIPANVSYIGSLAFGSLYNLETFTIDEENSYFTIYDGVLYSKDMSVLKICPSGKESVSIPEGVVELEAYSFNDCSSLTEIILPESLKIIKMGAFADCHRLPEITIPANVEIMDGTPFTNCSRMTAIHVDEGNRVFASEDGILYSKDFKTLIRCPERKETVTISDKTTEIAMEAFFARRIADKLVIGENVSKIVAYAFYAAHCTDITFLNPNCVFDETGEGYIFDKEVVTVHGYEGSTAQAYAEKYEIPFSSLDAEDNMFKDVPKNQWYYEPAKFAIENGLMTGKGNTADGRVIFDPANYMTRAEFVQVLYSKEGKPPVEYKDIFADVKENDWFAKAIIWANENSIVKGSGDIFNVNGKITRQEMVAILYKYAMYKEYDVSEKADLSGFVDDETVASWAVPGMQWGVKYGVISGKKAEGGNAIAPNGNAIRAEAATMMRSFMRAYEGAE